MRGGRREGLKVGEGEEVLEFVSDDHQPLSDRVFTVGGVYEALELDAKRAMDMRGRPAHKIQDRG